MAQMRQPAGVAGYGSAIEEFTTASQRLRFEEVCSAFLPYLPRAGAAVLDAGSGVGQNAAWLSRMGYRVDAVEPFAPFRRAAVEVYGRHGVRWIMDSLPYLESLGTVGDRYSFILVEGVWHHLDPSERIAGLERLGALLQARGVLCVSLRHGPPGVGTRVFPTDADETIEASKAFGFRSVAVQRRAPSVIPGKTNVTWSRVTLQLKSSR